MANITIKPDRIELFEVKDREVRIKFKSGTTWLWPIARGVTTMYGEPHIGLIAEPNDCDTIEAGGLTFKDGSKLPGFVVCPKCNTGYKPNATKCDCWRKTDDQKKQAEAVKP